MNGIKRYKTDDDGTLLDEAGDGAYVEYSDYEKLEEQVKSESEAYQNTILHLQQLLRDNGLTDEDMWQSRNKPTDEVTK